MNREFVARRPLKSRETPWAQFLSQWLIKKGLRPNQISIAGIIFAIVAGICFLQLRSFLNVWERVLFYCLAAVCIQLRLLCNLLDGMVAIEGGLKSKTGDVFNDFPDRIADSIILVCAGFSISRISFGVHLGWLAALVATMTAYVRTLGGSLGVTQHFCGPMAKPHRMAALTTSCLLSCGAVFFEAQDYVVALGLMLIIIGSVVTLARRISKMVKELKEK